MGPQDIFERCMNGSIGKLVKGGLVYQYFRSPFFVWCSAFAPKEERDRESAYMNMILGNGRRHEDDVCREIYPGGLEIDPTQHEKAFLQSLEGMFAGEAYIKNGIFYYLPERLVAVPDVLVKVPGPSVFGDWHYEVVEIKSSKHIKMEHIMQAAYYNYILGIIQGASPEIFVMVDGQKKQTPCRYEDYKEKVQETIRTIKNILGGFRPQVEKVGWPWESFSVKKLKEEKGVALIPRLFSAHRQLLEDAGITRLDDFLAPNTLNVKGIAHEKLEYYKMCAQAMLTGKHTFLNKPFLPEGTAEVFMDFEGVDNVWMNGKRISGDYLIGVLVRENGREHYHPFVAESLTDEHTMVLEFLKFLRGLKDDFVIYHFGAHERAHLAGLLNKHGIDKGFSRNVMNAMVDVFQLARKSVVFPTHSYSLKEIGNYLGFQWRGVADARDSIVLYIDFVKTGKRELLDAIVRYNEDDCLALKKVKDFLVWGT